MAQTYMINKGVGKPLQFKGVKGRYLWWTGGSLVGTLILFVIMYIAGLNSYLCIVIALAIGASLLITLSRLSHRYGEHGLMKALAHRNIPTGIRNHSRKCFINLTKEQ